MMVLKNEVRVSDDRRSFEKRRVVKMMSSDRSEEQKNGARRGLYARPGLL
jgi:hypothetical protein